MSRSSSGDLYSMILYYRKILPIFFLSFTCFSFLTSTSICIGFFEMRCSLHWIVHQNGISCRTGNEFWDHILDLISGFESADRNVVKNDHAYECFIIVTVIYLRLWCRLSIKQSWNCVNEKPSIWITSGRTQYRHLFHNREFHNINCRFCGAFLGCEGQI